MTTRIVRNPENVFVLQNDLVLGNVGIEAKDGSELYFAEGKNLYYDNVTIYLDKTALELTGQRFNSYTNLKLAEAEKAKAGSAKSISDNELELEKLGNKGGKDKDDDGKGNVGLYIGLGIGGLALVGLLVYLISKKK